MAVLPVTPKDVLSERDLFNVDSMINRCIAELALLGDLDGARNLLTMLYEAGAPCGMYMHGMFSKRYDGLAFAWRLSGRNPPRLTDSELDASTVSARECYIDDWPHHIPDAQRTRDEPGLTAILEIDPSTGVTMSPEILASVKGLDISLELNACDELRDGTGPVSLSDLDTQSATFVRGITARWNGRKLDNLCFAERLWPYFLRGLLADANRLSKEDVRIKSKHLLEAFTKRLSHGNVPSSLSSTSWKKLLELGERNTLRGSASEQWRLEYQGAKGNEDKEYKTLFRNAATEEEIKALEVKLDISLPDDYKDFLRISNGFGSDNDYSDGIFNGFYSDPALWPVDKVQWLNESYFQLLVELLQLPRTMEALGPVQEKVSAEPMRMKWKTPFPLFDRVLEIGTRDVDNLWLVHPGLVTECKAAYKQMYEKADEKQKKIIVRAMEAFAGSKEEFEQLQWCCVKWSSGGAATATAYASFRRYMECLVEDSGKDKRKDSERLK